MVAFHTQALDSFPFRFILSHELQKDAAENVVTSVLSDQPASRHFFLSTPTICGAHVTRLEG